ncbi:MAG: molybdopterin-guanine dinucleotide biosynthesis protein B [Pseudomonadota bacterium]
MTRETGTQATRFAMPLFGVTGWKNSGKTTLTSRLITELVARGYRVHAVKHAHHAFDIDREGTDSYRHRTAGATETAIVSNARWALMHELRDAEEPPLGDIIARLSPADIVIIEGYKREAHPKIECRRTEARAQTPLAPIDPTIRAIACEAPSQEGDLPEFHLDNVSAIADFVERLHGLDPARAMGAAYSRQAQE